MLDPHVLQKLCVQPLSQPSIDPDSDYAMQVSSWLALLRCLCQLASSHCWSCDAEGNAGLLPR